MICGSCPPVCVAACLHKYTALTKGRTNKFGPPPLSSSEWLHIYTDVVLSRTSRRWVDRTMVCRVTARWTRSCFCVARPDSGYDCFLSSEWFEISNHAALSREILFSQRSVEEACFIILVTYKRTPHLVSATHWERYIFKKKKKKLPTFFYYYWFSIQRKGGRKEKTAERAFALRTWTLAKASCMRGKNCYSWRGRKSRDSFQASLRKKGFTMDWIQPTYYTRRRVFSFFVRENLSSSLTLTLIWSQISSRRGGKEENGAFRVFNLREIGARRFCSNDFCWVGSTRRERRGRRPEQSTDRTEEDFSVYGRVIGSHLIQ